MKKIPWVLSALGGGYGILSVLLVFLNEGASLHADQLLQAVAWLLLAIAASVCPLVLALSIERLTKRSKG